MKTENKTIVQKLLAIETSGQTFSIALAENNVVVAERYLHSGMVHSEKIMPSIQGLLSDMNWQPQELTAIAVSCGPGSFTGIRVGMTCARTMAQMLDIPVYGEDTLAILAAAIPQGVCEIVPLIDALRGEVYAREKDGTVGIVPIDALAHRCPKKKTVIFVGNAVPLCRAVLTKALGARALFAEGILNFPRAGILAQSVAGKKPFSYKKLKPLYIRRSWAEENTRSVK